jgi:hypothetical protein
MAKISFPVSRVKALLFWVCLSVTLAFSLACSNPNVSTTVAPRQYSLKTSSVPEAAGSITPAGGTFVEGSNIDLSVHPAQGYEFEYWEGDVSGTSTSARLVMNTEKSVIAHFKAIPVPKEKYLLETSVEPAGAGTIIPGAGTYEEGTAVNVNTTASAGYQFDYWKGDIDSKSSSADIVMDRKKSITAHFTKIHSLNTRVIPDGAGTITPAAGSYGSGSTVTVTATAAGGYSFDHWSGDNENNANPQSLIFDKNKDLIAYFVPSRLEIKQGVDKSLITVVATGTGYLNVMELKITSSCKAAITVDIPAGTVFAPLHPEQACSRMITLEKMAVYLGPGAVQQKPLYVASADIIMPPPEKNIPLVLDKAAAPDDVFPLFKSDAFNRAEFRTKQFAVWIVTSYVQVIGDMKIGPKGDEQKLTDNELKQIKDMFIQAGLSLDKYPVLKLTSVPK